MAVTASLPSGGKARRKSSEASDPLVELHLPMVWVTQGITDHAAYILREAEDGRKFVKWVANGQTQWVEAAAAVKTELPKRRRGRKTTSNDEAVPDSVASAGTSQKLEEKTTKMAAKTVKKKAQPSKAKKPKPQQRSTSHTSEKQAGLCETEAAETKVHDATQQECPAKIMTQATPQEEEKGNNSHDGVESSGQSVAAAGIPQLSHHNHNTRRASHKGRLERRNDNSAPAAESPKAPPKPKYPIGTKLYKEFPPFGWFTGEVVAFDGTMYKTTYEDGDSENVTEKEIDGIVGGSPAEELPLAAKDNKMEELTVQPAGEATSSSPPFSSPAENTDFVNMEEKPISQAAEIPMEDVSQATTQQPEQSTPAMETQINGAEETMEKAVSLDTDTDLDISNLSALFGQDEDLSLQRPSFSILQPETLALPQNPEQLTPTTPDTIVEQPMANTAIPPQTLVGGTNADVPGPASVEMDGQTLLSEKETPSHDKNASKISSDQPPLSSELDTKLSEAPRDVEGTASVSPSPPSKQKCEPLLEDDSIMQVEPENDQSKVFGAKTMEISRADPSESRGGTNSIYNIDGTRQRKEETEMLGGRHTSHQTGKLFQESSISRDGTMTTAANSNGPAQDAATSSIYQAVTTHGNSTVFDAANIFGERAINLECDNPTTETVNPIDASVSHESNDLLKESNIPCDSNHDQAAEETRLPCTCQTSESNTTAKEASAPGGDQNVKVHGDPGSNSRTFVDSHTGIGFNCSKTTGAFKSSHTGRPNKSHAINVPAEGSTNPCDGQSDATESYPVDEPKAPSPIHTIKIPAKGPKTPGDEKGDTRNKSPTANVFASDQKTPFHGQTDTKHDTAVEYHGAISDGHTSTSCVINIQSTNSQMPCVGLTDTICDTTGEEVYQTTVDGPAGTINESSLAKDSRTPSSNDESACEKLAWRPEGGRPDLVQAGDVEMSTTDDPMMSDVLSKASSQSNCVDVSSLVDEAPSEPEKKHFEVKTPATATTVEVTGPGHTLDDEASTSSQSSAMNRGLLEDAVLASQAGTIDKILCGDVKARDTTVQNTEKRVTGCSSPGFAENAGKYATKSSPLIHNDSNHSVTEMKGPMVKKPPPNNGTKPANLSKSLPAPVPAPALSPTSLTTPKETDCQEVKELAVTKSPPENGTTTVDLSKSLPAPATAPTGNKMSKENVGLTVSQGVEEPAVAKSPPENGTVGLRKSLPAPVIDSTSLTTPKNMDLPVWQTNRLEVEETIVSAAVKLALDMAPRPSEGGATSCVDKGTLNRQRKALAQTPLASSGSGARLNRFVRQLHDMLQAEKNSGIVEWRQGLIVLHSTDAFAKTILPKYFNSRNFKTFRRQLNYYGFVHVRSFSTTGSTTTALWINRDLAKLGNAEIASVLKLKRVEHEVAKTAESRYARKEQVMLTVEEDIGVTAESLQMEHLRSLTMGAGAEDIDPFFRMPGAGIVGVKTVESRRSTDGPESGYGLCATKKAEKSEAISWLNQSFSRIHLGGELGHSYKKVARQPQYCAPALGHGSNRSDAQLTLVPEDERPLPRGLGENRECAKEENQMQSKSKSTQAEHDPLKDAPQHRLITKALKEMPSLKRVDTAKHAVATISNRHHGAETMPSECQSMPSIATESNNSLGEKTEHAQSEGILPPKQQKEVSAPPSGAPDFNTGTPPKVKDAVPKGTSVALGASPNRCSPDFNGDPTDEPEQASMSEIEAVPPAASEGRNVSDSVTNTERNAPCDGQDVGSIAETGGLKTICDEDDKKQGNTANPSNDTDTDEDKMAGVIQLDGSAKGLKSRFDESNSSEGKSISDSSTAGKELSARVVEPSGLEYSRNQASNGSKEGAASIDSDANGSSGEAQSEKVDGCTVGLKSGHNQSKDNQDEGSTASGDTIKEGEREKPGWTETIEIDLTQISASYDDPTTFYQEREESIGSDEASSVASNDTEESIAAIERKASKKRARSASKKKSGKDKKRPPKSNGGTTKAPTKRTAPVVTHNDPEGPVRKSRRIALRKEDHKDSDSDSEWETLPKVKSRASVSEAPKEDTFSQQDKAPKTKAKVHPGKRKASGVVVDPAFLVPPSEWNVPQRSASGSPVSSEGEEPHDIGTREPVSFEIGAPEQIETTKEAIAAADAVEQREMETAQKIASLIYPDAPSTAKGTDRANAVEPKEMDTARKIASLVYPDAASAAKDTDRADAQEDLLGLAAVMVSMSASAPAETSGKSQEKIQTFSETTCCPVCSAHIEALDAFPVDWSRPLYYPNHAPAIEAIREHTAKCHYAVPTWNVLEATVGLCLTPPTGEPTQNQILTPVSFVKLALRHAVCSSYAIDESLLDMQKLRDMFVRRLGIARGFIEWSSDVFVQGYTFQSCVGEPVSNGQLRRSSLLLLAYLEDTIMENAFVNKLDLTQGLARSLPFVQWRNMVQNVFLHPDGVQASWFMQGEAVARNCLLAYTTA